MGRKRTKGSSEPGRRRLNLTLDSETHRRLGAFAAFTGRSISAVVSDAVLTQMRGFVVSQRGVGPVASPALAEETREAG